MGYEIESIQVFWTWLEYGFKRAAHIRHLIGRYGLESPKQLSTLFYFTPPTSKELAFDRNGSFVFVAWKRRDHGKWQWNRTWMQK